MKMKNKKMKIIAIALICAGIVSICSIVVMAASGDQTNIGNSLLNKVQLTFKTVSEKAVNFIKGNRDGYGFMAFKPEDIASFLGITVDEFKTKLEEADGNIVKVLQDSGKLEEYKTKVLADYKTKLDEAVTAGKMTQEQADEYFAKAQEMTNNIENGDVRIGFGFNRGYVKEFKVYGGGICGGDVNLADILGITEDELKTKFQENNGNIYKILDDAGKLEEYKIKVLENCKVKLDEAVAAGKMTQEQADTQYAAMQEKLNNLSGDSDIVTNFRDFIGGQKIFDGKHEGFGFGMNFGGMKINLADIASILGITEDELKTKIEENQGNIFKILADSGKLDEYKTKALETVKVELDKQVADGKITQERADELFASITESVNNLNADSGNFSNFNKNEARTRTWDGNGGKSGKQGVKVTVENSDKSI